MMSLASKLAPIGALALFLANPAHEAEARSPASRVAYSSRDIDVDPDLEPNVPGSIRSRATVQISAPCPAVRDAILDLQARADEGWMVESVNVYRNEVSDERIHRRARWTLSVLGFQIIYHTVYDWDAASNTIVWSLDESRLNDLTAAEGVYELRPRGKGKSTELAYTVEVGTKHAGTRALERRLTVRNIERLLESVRRRAEG